MSSMAGPKPASTDQWIYPDEPGKLGEKLLMAAALSLGIFVMFETHFVRTI